MNCLSMTFRHVQRTLLFCLSLLVLPAVAQTTTTEKQMQKQGMVNVQEIDPSLQVALMYARADNFTGKVLYTDLTKAYLHPEAARALRKAQTLLKKTHPDLSLKIYDAARPMSVQARMFNVVAGTPKNIYVSNPRHGGGLHNYGLAVDITLCHASTGDTLDMGTKIDYMGKLAHVDQEAAMLHTGKLSVTALRNRRLLRQVMGAAGFKVLRTEWWHFNFKTRAEAKAHYQLLK